MILEQFSKIVLESTSVSYNRGSADAAHQYRLAIKFIGRFVGNHRISYSAVVVYQIMMNDDCHSIPDDFGLIMITVICNEQVNINSISCTFLSRLRHIEWSVHNALANVCARLSGQEELLTLLTNLLELFVKLGLAVKTNSEKNPMVAKVGRYAGPNINHGLKFDTVILIYCLFNILTITVSLFIDAI